MRALILFAGLAFAAASPAHSNPAQSGPERSVGLKTMPVVTQQICDIQNVTPVSKIEVAPPEQNYEPSPAMWRIADEDTVIHLLGTYHVLPEGFRWRTQLLDQIIDEADEVVFESRDDSDEGSSVDIPQLRTLIREYAGETPISMRLSKYNRGKWFNILAGYGIPAERIDNAPPIMAMFALAMASSRAEGSTSSLGVESVIEREFQDTGRPITAIEDPMEVLENMMRIDGSLLIGQIDKGLDGWDGCNTFEAGETDWTSVHAWAQGQLDDAFMEDMASDEMGRAFYDVLLTDRNRHWGLWIDERLDRPGNLLIAVGAGHMEGANSLLVMLEEHGITAERIQ